ncbi:hypothetical protein MG9_05728 [Candida albicans P37037]|nr:hypothetical protein MG9_05728 [Candida albicans P37037]
MVMSPKFKVTVPRSTLFSVISIAKTICVSKAMETKIFWNSCMWKIEDWFVVMKKN